MILCGEIVLVRTLGHPGRHLSGRHLPGRNESVTPPTTAQTGDKLPTHIGRRKIFALLLCVLLCSTIYSSRASFPLLY